MPRLLAAVLLLVLLAGSGGCTWQANRGSQAVDINPGAIGSGESVFTPSNSFGNVNGESLDMRTKR